MKSSFRFQLSIVLLSLLVPCNSLGISAVVPVTPMQAPAGAPVSQTGQISATPAGLTENAVGIVAAVQGVVEAVSPGQPSRTLKSGMPVFLGDQVTTDAQGHLQLLLRDETAFTLGASSSITIDEFVFDPSTNIGKVGAKVGKGVFRFITGKIAKKDPKNMTVKLPVGTIGIRGTIVAGKVEETKSRVLLLGPGENNNTGDRAGKIIVENQVGNKTEKVNVTHPGFATTIEPGIPPTPPAQAPVSEIQSITNALQGNLNAQKAADNANTPQAQNQPNATQQAKQDTFQAMSDITNTQKASEVTETADNNSNEAAQDKAETTATITDGISTLQQLLSVTTGTGCFSSSGTPLSNGDNYSFYLQINFGTKMVGGGSSEISTATTGGQYGIPPVPFEQFCAGGNANFTYNHLHGSVMGYEANVNIQLNNSGGAVAQNANHSVDISYMGSPEAQGSGTAARC